MGETITSLVARTIKQEDPNRFKRNPFEFSRSHGKEKKKGKGHGTPEKKK